MGVVEAILAVIGLLALLLVAAGALADASGKSTAASEAAPDPDGLQAAQRIQRAAEDLARIRQ